MLSTKKKKRWEWILFWGLGGWGYGSGMFLSREALRNGAIVFKKQSPKHKLAAFVEPQAVMRSRLIHALLLWKCLFRFLTGTGLIKPFKHGCFIVANVTIFICFNSMISSVNKNVYLSYLKHPLKCFNINFMEKFQQNYISFFPIKVTLWTFNRALSYNGFYWPNY